MNKLPEDHIEELKHLTLSHVCWHQNVDKFKEWFKNLNEREKTVVLSYLDFISTTNGYGMIHGKNNVLSGSSS